MTSSGKYRPLDLAIAIDCTGSMEKWILEARKTVKSIAEDIVKVRKTDVKIALIKFRDHPPEDQTYVTDVLDFTSHEAVTKELDTATADGGGDTPEAVVDALEAVTKLSWREAATKMCIMVADAPPHGVGYPNDSFPEGCPEGLSLDETIDNLAKKKITVHVVSCGIPKNSEGFFIKLCEKTAGDFKKLDEALSFAEVILAGIRSEQDIVKLIEEELKDVCLKMQKETGSVNKLEIANMMRERLQMKDIDMTKILLKMEQL